MKYAFYFVDYSVYNHGVDNMRMMLPKNVPIYVIHSMHYDDLIFHPKTQGNILICSSLMVII